MTGYHLGAGLWTDDVSCQNGRRWSWCLLSDESVILRQGQSWVSAVSSLVKELILELMMCSNTYSFMVHHHHHPEHICQTTAVGNMPKWTYFRPNIPWVIHCKRMLSHSLYIAFGLCVSAVLLLVVIIISNSPIWLVWYNVDQVPNWIGNTQTAIVSYWHLRFIFSVLVLYKSLSFVCCNGEVLHPNWLDCCFLTPIWPPVLFHHVYCPNRYIIVPTCRGGYSLIFRYNILYWYIDTVD